MDTSLFRKADRFCGLASTWTVENSLDNVNTGRLLAQDCLPPLMIHQLDSILTLVRIVLTSFLPSYSKGELWSVAMPAGNISRDTYTLDSTNAVRIIGVPLYTNFPL